MEIGNDLIAGLRNRLDLGGADRVAGHPDWSVLQARYCAAHAARRELLSGVRDRPQLNGSFYRAAAMALTGANEQHAVNRTDLGDGKHPGSMNGFTGGATMTGGRGR